MVNFLKVRDNKDLVRHRESSAVLNTNNKELNKYRQEREEKLKLNKLVEENEQMKSDIDEIKYLLRQLIGQK